MPDRTVLNRCLLGRTLTLWLLSTLLTPLAPPPVLTARPAHVPLQSDTGAFQSWGDNLKRPYRA